MEHVKNKPFVLALTPYHDPTSHYFSFGDLGRYLFGITPEQDSNGQIISFKKIEEHRVKERSIRSGFFFNYDKTENISAVIFSNQAGQQKFQRMGYLKGYGAKEIAIVRTFYRNTLKGDRESVSFLLSDPRYSEIWADGLTVFHNPNAKVPLNPNFFRNDRIIQYCLEDGVPKLIGNPNWLIAASQDIVFSLNK